MTLKVKKAAKDAQRQFTIRNIGVEFREGDKIVSGTINCTYDVLPESDFSELRTKGDHALALKVIFEVSGIGTEDDPWTPEEQTEYARMQPELSAALVAKYIEQVKTKHYTRGN